MSFGRSSLGWSSLRRSSLRQDVASARGMSLLDLVFALALMGIAAGMGLVRLERALADVRETGAARALAARIRQVRAEAVRLSTAVGLQFVVAEGRAQFRAYADGNGNGLRTRDISAGVDPPLAPPETLADATGAVHFGLDGATPEVSDTEGSSGGGASGAASESGGSGGSGASGASDDPIRLGSSNLLTFSATGSGTSGTIYLRGATRQFALRVYGPTGRIRLLELDRESGTWVER